MSDQDSARHCGVGRARWPLESAVASTWSNSSVYSRSCIACTLKLSSTFVYGHTIRWMRSPRTTGASDHMAATADCATRRPRRTGETNSNTDVRTRQKRQLPTTREEANGLTNAGHSGCCTADCTRASADVPVAVECRESSCLSRRPEVQASGTRGRELVVPARQLRLRRAPVGRWPTRHTSIRRHSPTRRHTESRCPHLPPCRSMTRSRSSRATCRRVRAEHNQRAARPTRHTDPGASRTRRTPANTNHSHMPNLCHAIVLP